MTNRKPEIVQARNRDGSLVRVVVPVTRLDVEQQPNVPAHVLALLAFSQVVNGVRRWSQYTALTFRRLSGQYGDDALRTTLCALLDDIAAGFRPSNPIGIYIHRVRSTATTSDLDI